MSKTLSKPLSLIHLERINYSRRKAKESNGFYFSTAQVYDTISDRLIDETSQTLSKNSYALTHEMAERCLSLDIEEYQTKVTVIRLTNAFDLLTNQAQIVGRFS